MQALSTCSLESWDLTITGPIHDLCKRTYWRRLWIFQELKHAKAITLMCGGMFLPGETFTATWATVHRSPVYLHIQLVNRMKTGLATGMVTRRTASLKASLWTLLHETQDLHCTDKRDKVYALLSVATDGHESIEADYSGALSSSDYWDNLSRLGHLVLRNRWAISPPTSLDDVVQDCMFLTKVFKFPLQILWPYTSMLSVAGQAQNLNGQGIFCYGGNDACRNSCRISYNSGRWRNGVFPECKPLYASHLSSWKCVPVRTANLEELNNIWDKWESPWEGLYLESEWRWKRHWKRFYLRRGWEQMPKHQKLWGEIQRRWERMPSQQEWEKIQRGCEDCWRKWALFHQHPEVTSLVQDVPFRHAQVQKADRTSSKHHASRNDEFRYSKAECTVSISPKLAYGYLSESGRFEQLLGALRGAI